MSVQLVPVLSDPTWQPPPCALDAAPAVALDPAASTPLSRAPGKDGAVEPTVPNPPPEVPAQIGAPKRSALGAMHTLVQDPSLARIGPLQPTSHPQVHVDGQSESTLHAVVCGATHVFQETSVHVVPASQMAGIGKPAGGAASPSRFSGEGTALHGTVVTVA